MLRTATSCFNRSPEHLLHEIILVDDFSDRDDVKGTFYFERKTLFKNFLGIGKNVRLLIQSYLFSPDLSDSSKAVHMIFKKFSSMILRPKVLLRSTMASKLFHSNVSLRNIAEITFKNNHFWSFFRYSQKLSIRFERSFFTIILHRVRVLCVQ